MITGTIVIASIALAAAFTVGWLLLPGLRAWIERPKYQFQERLRQYDRAVITRPDGDAQS